MRVRVLFVILALAIAATTDGVQIIWTQPPMPAMPSYMCYDRDNQFGVKVNGTCFTVQEIETRELRWAGAQLRWANDFADLALSVMNVSSSLLEFGVANEKSICELEKKIVRDECRELVHNVVIFAGLLGIFGAYMHSNVVRQAYLARGKSS
jgi:hypothetical protein